VSRLKAISLYTGVGGLDFGFEAAGFVTRVAVEMDPIACRVLRLNRKRWPVIEDRIENVSSSTLLEKANLKPGEADILIGGPPCQPFSKSSYWVRGDALRMDDPRADTLTSYLRVLRDTRPKAFLLENVYGLAYKGKDEGLRHLLEGIEEINSAERLGYRVRMEILNAAWHGVPQVRERAFLVGNRCGRPFNFPKPTHCDPRRNMPLDPAIEPYRNAWDAIGDLPARPNDPSLQIGGNWADLLPSIPEGQNYLWHTKRGGGLPLFGWRTRYWSFLLKLAKDQPSWTIQAQPGSAIGPFHWTNRKLSVAEMCRLQTFPEGLTFDCGRTDAQKLLGNAVPSLLAEILAREIRAQLLDRSLRSTSPKLLRPRSLPVPAPEKTARVPRKYLGLIGDHADHPGEGKGRGALRRVRLTDDEMQLSLLPVE
jgi:DNA (cytosine-5)-methyltransferase 1